MVALTVRQPWATLLAQGAKPVENRSWTPAAGLLAPGDWLAVHAANAEPDDVSGPDYAWLESITGGEIDCPIGGIVGVVRYTGWARPLTEAALDALGPWAAGPVVWQFDRSIPVPDPYHPALDMRGRLGLWPVPPRAEALLTLLIDARS